MTQLVHNDVIGYLSRQKNECEGKIEIALARATSPERFRILYRDATIFKMIQRIPIFNALTHKGPRRFAPRYVFSSPVRQHFQMPHPSRRALDPLAVPS